MLYENVCSAEDNTNQRYFASIHAQTEKYETVEFT